MTILHIIVQFLGFSLQTVPVAVLSIVPFDDDMLSMSRKRLTLLYTAGMLILSLGFALISYFAFLSGIRDNDTERLFSNVYMTICVILWIITFFITVRCELAKKLLVLVLMLYYAATILVILNLCDTFLRNIPTTTGFGAYAVYDVLALFVLQAITGPLVVLFLKRKVRYSLSHIGARTLRRSNYYVSFALLLFFITAFSIQTFTENDIFHSAPILLCLLCFILTDGILYYMLFSEIQLTAQTLELENMLRSLDGQYREISATIEEARRARHDIRHHLNLISSMNHRGDKEALAAYLESYEASFRNLESASLCGYPAFDNILRYYIETANEYDINVNTELHPLHESLGFDVIDITVMLGNLMENAINACRALPDDVQRFINVWVKQADAAFLLEIENSCDTENEQPEFIDDPSFVNTKTVGTSHGLGLKSVGFAAEKYGGNAEFKKKAGVFTARVVMNIP